ncbi:MAG TPA: hypothetical protein VLI92_00745 [Candidatus Saccharimonadales bacterium]|nr:hypothetical protein [Candidatus Saccharimonadales bacterium]
MPGRVDRLVSLKREIVIEAINIFARKNSTRHDEVRAILAHLTEWDDITIRCIEAAIKQTPPPNYVENEDEFNAQAKAKWANVLDTDLVTAFIKMNDLMVMMYRKSQTKTKRTIWPNRKETIGSSLQIDIKHHEEHLKQLQNPPRTST